jgi:hypothetical protein
MATDHSYRITLKNNASEKEAIQFLLESDPRFLAPDKNSRKLIMELLNVKFHKVVNVFYLTLRSEITVI